MAGVAEARWLTEMASEGVVYDDVFPPFNIDFSPIIPVTVAVYLATVFGLRYAMRDRQPLHLNYLLAAHNFFLCAFSLVLFLGQSYVAYGIFMHRGLYGLYCGTFDDAWDYPMAQWSIAFYLSKYYELLDTIFLVLRKRPLTLLHVYHHSIVIPVSWMAVHSQIFMGWITAYNNAGVHVVMYFYFGMYALGYRSSLRKYITSLQLLQFFIDISTSVPFIVIYALGWECRGELYAWIIANLVGFTFVFLFWDFFAKNYLNKAKAGKKQA